MGGKEVFQESTESNALMKNPTGLGWGFVKTPCESSQGGWLIKPR